MRKCFVGAARAAAGARLAVYLTNDDTDGGGRERGKLRSILSSIIMSTELGLLAEKAVSSLIAKCVVPRLPLAIHADLPRARSEAEHARTDDRLAIPSHL